DRHQVVAAHLARAARRNEAADRRQLLFAPERLSRRRHDLGRVRRLTEERWDRRDGDEGRDHRIPSSAHVVSPSYWTMVNEEMCCPSCGQCVPQASKSTLPLTEHPPLP